MEFAIIVYLVIGTILGIRAYFYAQKQIMSDPEINISNQADAAVVVLTAVTIFFLTLIFWPIIIILNILIKKVMA